MINAFVTQRPGANWNVQGTLNNEAAGTQPEALWIFLSYLNNNERLNTYRRDYTVFCLINYPPDGIIALEFEAVIKAAYCKILISGALFVC